MSIGKKYVNWDELRTQLRRLKREILQAGFVGPGAEIEGVPESRMINTTSPLSGGGDLSSDLTLAIDTDYFLKLDQTTPQTVINGIPLLDQEYDDFSEPKEFVNKGYVDWVATAIGANYYMTDDDDGDTGYKVCSLTPPTGSETHIEVSNVSDDQLLGTWISDVGEAPAKLSRGMYNWYIFAEKVSGTKTLRLYWKMYERKTDDSEVLIATSSESNELEIGDKTGYIVPLALDSDYTPDSGSRIVGKIYASVSGSGNAPTVRLYYQGASGSRWEIPSSTEVLSNIYIKRDEIGIDDDDILQVDQAAGLTAGNLVRATSSGLESRTDAEILAQLSGKASSAFDWNGQNLTHVNLLEGYSITPYSQIGGMALDISTLGGDPDPMFITFLLNNIAFITYRGGSVSFNPSPNSGVAANLFDGDISTLVRWNSPSGNIVIEVTFPITYKYGIVFCVIMDDVRYATSFKAEYYDPVASSWVEIDDQTSWGYKNWIYRKSAGSNGASKFRFTAREYANASYFYIRQIIISNFQGKMLKDYYVTRDGGEIYDDLDIQAELRCDSFRIDQTPTAGTFTPDKYIIISCNGTDYKIPVKAV